MQLTDVIEITIPHSQKSEPQNTTEKVSATAAIPNAIAIASIIRYLKDASNNDEALSSSEFE